MGPPAQSTLAALCPPEYLFLAAPGSFSSLPLFLPVGAHDLEDGHLCQLHTIWLCWWRAGNQAGNPDFLRFGWRIPCGVLSLVKVAASSFCIKMRVGGASLDAYDPEDDGCQAPGARLTTSGCFLQGGAFTRITSSPTLIVGGNTFWALFGCLSASPPLLLAHYSRRSHHFTVFSPSCILFVLTPSHLSALASSSDLSVKAQTFFP